MTLGEFRRWSQDIPDDTPIESLIASGLPPHRAKRAVLCRYPGDNKNFIVINPMGTHLSDIEDFEIISSSSAPIIKCAPTK